MAHTLSEGDAIPVPVEKVQMLPFDPEMGGVARGLLRVLCRDGEEAAALDVELYDPASARRHDVDDGSTPCGAVCRVRIAKQLTAEEKKAKWQAYQALSLEEKSKLAAKASPKPKGAATAIKPVAPQKLVKIHSQPSNKPAVRPAPKIAPASAPMAAPLARPASDASALPLLR